MLSLDHRVIYVYVFHCYHNAFALLFRNILKAQKACKSFYPSYVFTDNFWSMCCGTNKYRLYLSIIEWIYYIWKLINMSLTYFYSSYGLHGTCFGCLSSTPIFKQKEEPIKTHHSPHVFFGSHVFFLGSHGKHLFELFFPFIMKDWKGNTIIFTTLCYAKVNVLS